MRVVTIAGNSSKESDVHEYVHRDIICENNQQDATI